MCLRIHEKSEPELNEIVIPTAICRYFTNTLFSLIRCFTISLHSCATLSISLPLQTRDKAVENTAKFISPLLTREGKYYEKEKKILQQSPRRARRENYKPSSKGSFGQTPGGMLFIIKTKSTKVC